MVSNALDMDQQDLIAALQRIRGQFRNTPEYKELRKTLPADWPI